MKILTSIALAAFVSVSGSSRALAQDWEVFSSGTVDQVRAEILKLPESTGLETRGENGLTALTRRTQRADCQDI